MPTTIVRRPFVADQHLLETTHQTLQRVFTLYPKFQQIFATRGVSSPQQLEYTFQHLETYHTFKSIDSAVALLVTALKYQQKIIIVGDFDADGATSSAVMVLGLQAFGFQYVDYLVPDRFNLGYGLSIELAQILLQQQPDVVITVDNGISSCAGVELLRQHNIVVIVTDHHLPGTTLPNAHAIVNPNQVECKFPSKNLAGVGVAFYLLTAFRSEFKQHFPEQNVPNLASLLDLVALGTIADVVPLDANNRILVAAGLERIKQQRCRPGILALLAIAKRSLSHLTATDLAFAVAPRLNAAGRLDDMSLGIECLLTNDPNQAQHIAYQLDQLNQERREIEADMQVMAAKLLQKLKLDPKQHNTICLYQADWHQGVIGILAGRLKDQYHLPTAIFASDGHEYLKGSARSIHGIHMRDVFAQIDQQHPGLLIKFGGHAMAAGLTINASDFERFSLLFEQIIAQQITTEQKQSILLSDGFLTESEFTLDFAYQLKSISPWGQSFPEPLFDDEFKIIEQRIVGHKHLKLILAHSSGLQIDAIKFSIDLEQWPNHHCRDVHIAFTLDINEFRGNKQLQLLIKTLQPIYKKNR